MAGTQIKVSPALMKKAYESWERYQRDNEKFHEFLSAFIEILKTLPKEEKSNDGH